MTYRQPFTNFIMTTKNKARTWSEENQVDKPGSLVPTWHRHFHGKWILFNPEKNETIQSGHSWPGKCTHVTPKGADRGVPDAELCIQGQSGRSMWIRVVANAAKPFDTWIEAHTWLKKNEPDNPYIGATQRPELVQENLYYQHNPRTTWEEK
jgi:hypothetical protein